jgi:hypothetical protein
MWGAALVLFAITAAKPLIAQGLFLRIENPAKLDEHTLKAFRTELDTILTASGRRAALTPCSSTTVSVTLRTEPPAEEPSALGGIRRRDGRLVPEIELFVSPTAQIIGTRLPAVLGRALARVATHELGHWLSPDSPHAERGVMMERLSSAHLMASDNDFFRLPSGN